METLEKDPFDWTVEEVVDFLCHNPEQPWSQSAARLPAPPDSFEASLRDNLITGEVLLQDVDKEALRNDLGLKALGHRSSFMMAIRFLQQHSTKFQQAVAIPQLDAPGLPSPLPLPFSPQGHRRHSSFVPPSNTGNSVQSVAQVAVHSPAPATRLEGRDTEGIRTHERIIVDKHGRKRRKLDLSSFAEVQSDELEPEYPDNRFRDWYMGPDSLTPAQMFYSPDPDGDDQTFAFIASKLPTAQRSFVNKCLIHFFRQSPIKLAANRGHSQWAVLPYRSSNSQRLFTLYTAKDGNVTVSKERVDEWPQLMQQQETDNEVRSSAESLKPSDPFSYLLQKYPVRDLEDALPLYGDSGSEGDYDEETWQEIEDERSGTPIPKPTKLDSVEIDSIVKECISDYEDKWRRDSLKKEQYKSRKLWLDARKGNRANQEIKALTKDISLLEARLRKLQDAICRGEYSSETELRNQCQSLEQTVWNIQKQKWRVSVLEQERCPPKVPAPPRPKYQRKERYGDEESLDSESDDSSNGSLRDFIIDDTGMHETLPTQNRSALTSSSDGDDDIISVSGTRRRTRGRGHTFFSTSSPSQSPSPPPPCRLTKKKPDVIDLTVSEPEDLRIETPPLNPQTMDLNLPNGSSLPPQLDLGPAVKTENGSLSSPLPALDDMDRIQTLDWEFLEERHDRCRLLARLVGSISGKEREQLRKIHLRYHHSQLSHYTRRALHQLLKGKDHIPGIPSHDSNLVMRMASFYISWVNCVRLRQEGIEKKLVLKTLEDDDLGYENFRQELCARLESCRTWKRDKGAAADLGHHLESESTPHKKRKREVKESQAVKMNQASAQLRVARQEEQRKKLEEKLESRGLSNDNPSMMPVSFKDPIVYLDPHIGRRVKPHQLSGIQFMWRELIEDKVHQGCLLAHTMGLGKTMQVISLLNTISAAATSNNPKIRQQVPEVFHRPQTLILCPSSLIENWHEEFLMWTPKNSCIGPVRRVLSNGTTRKARLGEISNWYEEGGVLLISYDIFRGFILNKETPKRPKPLSDTEHEKVKKWLLEGPSIIVADEAHKMKNPSSEISAAAMQFRSKSRVALTGSPLANNLADYYTMVNWIAEGYLGSFVEFKAHYIEPIEEGLYADSTYAERRRSLMRLQVLKKILEPKINRADVTVLEGSLPSKVEFLITVPLTKLQKAAYDSYASLMLHGGSHGEVGNAKLWSWLAILGLCCNHPACFREKLTSRANNNDPARQTDDTEQEVPGDEPITQAGVPDLASLVAEQERVFARVSDLKAAELSARSEILNRIIDESIRAGDKVLVFSQSLPTLNYIEHLLKVSGRSYFRLDGQTPISSRQQATKQFNAGAESHVYLISTRAGGLGLNIPGANRVIIFDFSFSPVWEEQAVGRAYRLGQQKPVFVYRFIAGGTFEEIIHQKAVFKTQLAVRVVDKKNPVRFASKKLGDYLFPAKPVPQEDVSAYMGKDPLVLDKILLEDEKKDERLIRKITLTQTFHKEDNDRLTEDEKKSVQEELDDEQLKRTDPAAYHKKVSEREKQKQQQVPYPNSSASPYGAPFVHNVQQYPIPSSAHNVGPPALGPDMTVYHQPHSNMTAVTTMQPRNQLHTPQPRVPPSAASELSYRQVQQHPSPQTRPIPDAERATSVQTSTGHSSNPTQARQQAAPALGLFEPAKARTLGAETPTTNAPNGSQAQQAVLSRRQTEPSIPRTPGAVAPKANTVSRQSAPAESNAPNYEPPLDGSLEPEPSDVVEEQQTGSDRSPSDRASGWTAAQQLLQESVNFSRP